ncbi:MAG: SIMPL domain-containing protein [Casimicrobiaceae bacterium]
MKILLHALATTGVVLATAWSWPAAAQFPSPPPGQPITPAVTVNATASTNVANDRVQAVLRAEAENVDAAAAASQVNAAIAKGVARAKNTPGVKVATSGYSTQQIAEKNRPTRWRVVQSITVNGSEFATIATLLTRLQEQDGLLLSGMGFSLSSTAREAAEGTLIQEAIKSWQSRADLAATALGFASWRPGRLSVQSADNGRPFPTMRAAGMVSADMAPVSMEAGLTEVTISVSGEAVLDQARAPR